jgi:hypothetical protein
MDYVWLPFQKNECLRENQKIIYPDTFVVYNQGTMQIETCITQ